MTTPYAAGAALYREAGWRGVLPLPLDAKSPPPGGFTGWEGADPTDDQVEDWARGKPYRATLDGIPSWIAPGNIGLRLPENVVGIDLDLYRPGADEVYERLTGELGPLPATWTATSRDDGSGIRLYRLPEPQRLGGSLGGAGEVIQRGHRYAVVSPSVHPDGRPYVWADPAGRLADEIPDPAGLILLPDPWRDHLSAPAGGGSSSRTRPTSDWSAEVRLAALDAFAGLDSNGRHDAMVAATMALVRLEALGHPGAGDALETLRRAYTAVVGAARGGVAAADDEYRRMVDGARRKLTAHPPAGPTFDELAEQKNVASLVVVRGAAEATAEAVAEAGRLDVYRDLSFPLDAYPAPVAEFVEAVATSLSVHPDAVASVVLPAAGAAIGNSRLLQAKADWEVRPAIWVAWIDEPGRKKSPAISRVMAPLGGIQRELHQSWKQARADWSQVPSKERGEEPKLKSIVVDDITAEALAEALESHPRGVLHNIDELTGFLDRMSEYKKSSSDRSRWLTIWSGGQWNKRRTSSPPIFISHPLVCLVGGIQPGVAGRLVEGDPDGLADRFLYAAPPPAGEADFRSPAVPWEVAGEWEEVIRRLYTLDMPMGAPVPVRFTTAGYEAFSAAQNRLLSEEHDAAVPAAYRRYWAKLEMYLARITLILAELWHVTTGETTALVTPEIAEFASAVVDHFKGQALKVFSGGALAPAVAFDRPGPQHVAALIDFVQSRGETTLRAATNSGPRALRSLSARGRLEVMAEAISAGAIRAVEQPKGQWRLSAI